MKPRYTRDDLLALWVFCPDPLGFCDLLAWLETLSDGKRQEQIDSANTLADMHGRFAA